MNSEDRSDLIDKFMSHTEFWDQSRKQNFKTACPYYTL